MSRAHLATQRRSNRAISTRVRRKLTQPTCAMPKYQLPQHMNGVCRKHVTEMERLYSNFFEAGMELVEAHAIPGVHPAKVIPGDNPFFNLASKFINDAVAIWSECLEAFERPESSAADRTQAGGEA